MATVTVTAALLSERKVSMYHLVNARLGVFPWWPWSEAWHASDVVDRIWQVVFVG